MMHHLNAVVLCALLMLPLCLVAQEAATYELAGLEVSGCDRTIPQMVQQMSGLQIGDKIQYPGSDLAQAIKRLLNRQRFADVQIIETQTKADLIWLNIEVTEAPLLSSIVVNGVNRPKTRKWEAWLTQYAPLETAWLPAHQAQLQLAIQRELSDQGYAATSVQLHTTPIRDGKDVQLHVNFDKLRKQKLKRLYWKGLHVAKERDLEKAMGLGLLRKINFTPSWHSQARASILHFYRDLGYLDAVITQDSSWQKEGQWEWQITISEGSPYYIGTVSWKGAEK